MSPFSSGGTIPENQKSIQGSHGSLFPEKVLTFERGCLGTGKVLNFNNFCEKVQEKSFLQIDK